MTTDDEDDPAKRLDGLAPCGLAWGHLTKPDARTPEQRREGERREIKRRAGKVRGRVERWWDRIPD